MELRWNPLLREWIAVASHRMERPQLPAAWCPFCPGSGKVPADYNVLIYPNDFPTFAVNSLQINIGGDELYRRAPSFGVCDVVLYHQDHNLEPGELSVEQWTKVIKLWQTRFSELAKIDGIEYIFIFENKGEEIGVTMPHPHGQIYAFPYIPPVVAKELESAREFQRHHKRCLFCTIFENEKAARVRMVIETADFIAFVPFFARWPYELHIYPRRHLGFITELTEAEITQLAELIKTLLLKYDHLFGFRFPYIMVQHAAPVGSEQAEKGTGSGYDYFHWHIEYYPPYRSCDKLKVRAGCESGAGTFINDSIAEEKARELREVKIPDLTARAARQEEKIRRKGPALFSP